jgi:hypothetical protein
MASEGLTMPIAQTSNTRKEYFLNTMMSGVYQHQ